MNVVKMDENFEEFWEGTDVALALLTDAEVVSCKLLLTLKLCILMIVDGLLVSTNIFVAVRREVLEFDVAPSLDKPSNRKHIMHSHDHFQRCAREQIECQTMVSAFVALLL